MKRQDIIKYSIIAVLVIAVIMLLISLVTTKKSKTDDKDDVFEKLYESEKAHRETLQKISEENARERDSLFTIVHSATEALKKNKIVHANIDKKFNDISKEINALGRNSDSIRRAYAEFQ